MRSVRVFFLSFFLLFTVLPPNCAPSVYKRTPTIRTSTHFTYVFSVELLFLFVSFRCVLIARLFLSVRFYSPFGQSYLYNIKRVRVRLRWRPYRVTQPAETLERTPARFRLWRNAFAWCVPFESVTFRTVHCKWVYGNVQGVQQHSRKHLAGLRRNMKHHLKTQTFRIDVI